MKYPLANPAVTSLLLESGLCGIGSMFACYGGYEMVVMLPTIEKRRQDAIDRATTRLGELGYEATLVDVVTDGNAVSATFTINSIPETDAEFLSYTGLLDRVAHRDGNSMLMYGGAVIYVYQIPPAVALARDGDAIRIDYKRNGDLPGIATIDNKAVPKIDVR